MWPLKGCSQLRYFWSECTTEILCDLLEDVKPPWVARMTANYVVRVIDLLGVPLSLFCLALDWFDKFWVGWLISHWIMVTSPCVLMTPFPLRSIVDVSELSCKPSPFPLPLVLYLLAFPCLASIEPSRAGFRPWFKNSWLVPSVCSSLKSNNSIFSPNTT